MAIVANATRAYVLEINMDEAMWKVNRWLVNRVMKLAPEKTEVTVLVGHRRKEVRFHLGGTMIVPRGDLKYLGIWLGAGINFRRHESETIKKARERATALGRVLQVLPNIGGPPECKRRLLWDVVKSILLYGAPIWKEIVGINKYRRELIKVQRGMLLRVVSGYRMISDVALQVIAEVPPLTC